jgi:hypothetical protein
VRFAPLPLCLSAQGSRCTDPTIAPAFDGLKISVSRRVAFSDRSLLRSSFLGPRSEGFNRRLSPPGFPQCPTVRELRDALAPSTEMSRKAQWHIYPPVIQTSRLRRKNFRRRKRGRAAQNFGCRARGECFISSRPSARCGNARLRPGAARSSGPSPARTQPAHSCQVAGLPHPPVVPSNGRALEGRTARPHGHRRPRTLPRTSICLTSSLSSRAACGPPRRLLVLALQQQVDPLSDE